MNQILHLAEQKMLESASHLKHIDELMAQTRDARARQLVRPELETQLCNLQQQRDRYGEELAAIRDAAHAHAQDALNRSQGLQGALETVGAELEKALAAMMQTAPKA